LKRIQQMLVESAEHCRWHRHGIGGMQVGNVMSMLFVKRNSLDMPRQAATFKHLGRRMHYLLLASTYTCAHVRTHAHTRMHARAHTCKLQTHARTHTACACTHTYVSGETQESDTQPGYRAATVGQQALATASRRSSQATLPGSSSTLVCN
jgi:hypothetical protein